MQLFDVAIERPTRCGRFGKLFIADSAEQARADAAASIAIMAPTFEVVSVERVSDAEMRAVVARLEETVQERANRL